MSRRNTNGIAPVPDRRTVPDRRWLELSAFRTRLLRLAGQYGTQAERDAYLNGRRDALREIQESFSGLPASNVEEG